VSSLQLPPSPLTESPPVFIIPSPIPSSHLSSNDNFSPLFIRVSREEMASTDSLDVVETCSFTQNSVRTFSFGSTLSYDYQSSTESCRTSSFSRARSKLRSLQQKVSSSVKYNIQEY
jgi:hypothetical protein